MSNVTVTHLHFDFDKYIYKYTLLYITIITTIMVCFLEGCPLSIVNVGVALYDCMLVCVSGCNYSF